MPDDLTPEVNLSVNDGITEEKDAGEVSGSVENVDDITPDKKEPDKKEPSQKEEPEKKSAPTGKEKESAEENRFKEIEGKIARLEQDKKNLQKALHTERQKKKEPAKEDSVTLSDDQLLGIIKENPENPEVLLRVVRYVSERAAKGEKAAAISEIDVSQKSKAVNNMVLERYPSLAEESSEMRTEIDAVKESLGLKDSPFGDAFAVGVKVVEQLPTLLRNAFEKGKAEALKDAAEKKRGDKIEDTKLTPKGKGKAADDADELTQDQSSTASQLGMTPSQKKIYAKLVGKQPKVLSVEE